MIQINIIPTDHSPNYRNALAYVPGEDRIGGIADYHAAKAELEAKGLTVISPRNGDNLPAGAIVEAWVMCMWCGGGSALGYRMPETAAAETVEVEDAATRMNAGEEIEDTASVATFGDSMDLMEMDDRNKHLPGWCTICHSFCYGDCQASGGRE